MITERSGDGVTAEDNRLILAELVRRAAANDREAWRELVERLGSVIWAVTRACTLTPADAADVEQMVWLRLVENLHRLRDPGRVGAWVATTARNECLRMHNRNRRTRPAEHGELDGPDHRSPETLALAAERDRVMVSVLDRLPAPCGLLLRLWLHEETLPVEDVAELTGLPVDQVRPARRNCLRRLRRRLRDLRELRGLLTEEAAPGHRPTGRPRRP